MKAIRFHEHGGPTVLRYEDVEDPKVGLGEAIVKVKAVSVNRIDVLVRKGYPGVKISLPHIPGADMAGVVEDVGPGVKNVSIGDRVIASPVYGCNYCEYCLKGMENMCDKWRMLGFHVDGTYAELVKVPSRILLPMPKNLSFEEGASLPLALLTAWHALITIGELKPNETVLVWAGGSGIGTFAIQIAKSRGAKVIATAGSEWKVKKLREMGVDLALNHYLDDVVSEVRKFTGNGVDIVVEHIGAQTVLRSIEAARVGGRIILFGAISGDRQTLPIRKIYLKHLTIRGMHTGARWELLEALELVKGKDIKPIIDSTFKLEEAPKAHMRLENSKHFGKIILKVK